MKLTKYLDEHFSKPEEGLEKMFEEFDINKLKMLVRKLETPHSYFEIIQELRYNNEPLNGDGFGDTTGKAFDVEIDD